MSRPAASAGFDAPAQSVDPWQRPLTGIERWQWLFDRAAVLNGAFVARVAGRFDQDRLRNAFDVVAARYPQLTARIEADRRPRFVSGARPLEVDVLPWEEGAWKRVALDQVNHRMATEDGPLARAILLDGADRSDLVVTFHHAAADGRSGAVIVDEILRLHAGAALAAEPQAEVLDPPMRSLLGSRLSAVKAAIREMRVARGMTAMPPERYVPVTDRRTGLIDTDLDVTTLQLLSDKARAQGATVHGALVAAMLLALEAEMRAADGMESRTLGCATPLDLRRHAGLSASAVGNVLSGVVGAHRVGADTSFWHLAAEASNSVRSAVDSGRIFAFARLQDMTVGSVRDLDKMVATAERYNRTAAIVTNLGRLDFGPRYGDLELERLGFLASTNANAGAALVLHATTVADATSLNFCFAEPLLSRDKARRLVDDMMDRVRAATV